LASDVNERPLLTATEDRPQTADILARPTEVSRAADETLCSSNANPVHHLSPVSIIRQTADVAVNTTSHLPFVVDDSCRMAVGERVHSCVNCAESKYNVNASMKVSSSNVCDDDVKHTVTNEKLEPQVAATFVASNNVCPPGDVVVKSEKDVRGLAVSEQVESNKQCLDMENPCIAIYKIITESYICII